MLEEVTDTDPAVDLELLHQGRPVHPAANIISLAGNMLQDFLAAHNPDPVVYHSPILQQWYPTELNQHKSILMLLYSEV